MTKHCNFLFYNFHSFDAKICSQFTCFPLVFFILFFSSSCLLDICFLACSPSGYSYSLWIFFSVFIFHKSSSRFWHWCLMFSFCKYWLHMLSVFNLTFPFIIISKDILGSCPREWIPIQLRNMKPSYVCRIWQIFILRKFLMLLQKEMFTCVSDDFIKPIGYIFNSPSPTC